MHNHFSDGNYATNTKTLRMKNADAITTLNIPIQESLKSRLRVVAKKCQKSLSQFTRDLIVEAIESFDTQERLKEEQKKQSLDEKRQQRRDRFSVLAPAQRNLAPDPARRSSSPMPSLFDNIDDVYVEKATRIAESVNDPIECRLRTREAVRDIEKQFPLTHPGAAEILRKLEVEVVKLQPRSSRRVETPPTPEQRSALDEVVDQLLNRQVDPTKTKTRVLGELSSSEDDSK